MDFGQPMISYGNESLHRDARVTFSAPPTSTWVAVNFRFDRVGSETNDQEDARARQEAIKMLQAALSALQASTT